MYTTNKMQLLLVRQRHSSQFVGIFSIAFALLLSSELGYGEPTNENIPGGSKNNNNDTLLPIAQELTVKKELNNTISIVEQTVKGEAAAAAAIGPLMPELTSASKQNENVLNGGATVRGTTNKTVANSQLPKASKLSIGKEQEDSSTDPLYKLPTIMTHHDQTILFNSDEEISDSLKAGFYFFVALSLSAITFIVFKVYRLRLSRAERKYGVQGDRSTQELTPLPIAIEDGASDDEDQTVFEVQRQNIRIL